MHEPISIQPDAVFDDGSLHLALGLTPSTLAKARRTGDLQFTRQGKRTLYLGQWILDWLRGTAQTAETRQGVADAK